MASKAEGQYSFSGRTIGRALRKRRGGGHSSSERRGLRMKTALKPSGKARFPRGYKYTYQDGTPCWGV